MTNLSLAHSRLIVCESAQNSFKNIKISPFQPTLETSCLYFKKAKKSVASVLKNVSIPGLHALRELNNYKFTHSCFILKLNTVIRVRPGQFGRENYLGISVGVGILTSFQNTRGQHPECDLFQLLICSSSNVDIFCRH